MHISLGDSLAGMFAVQGILAALYRRDALGGGVGQVVDVSLMESCFALLESTVPEYDRLGIVRGPQRHEPEGHRAVEHLQVPRRQVDGDRRERRQRLPPALRRDGQARARRRPEVRDAPRARREPGRDRGDRRRVGAASTTATEIDGSLNEAGVICGPIYTIADIFEDPQFQARDMLLKHEDPEFGEYIGPGIVPKLSRTPGAVRWSATWEEGSHNRGGLRRPARARRRRARQPARGGRAVTAVTVCDVAPRDGLQNDSAVLEPATRAELVNRLAARGRAAHRGRQLRQPGARAADGGRRGGRGRRSSGASGVVYAGLGAQRARLRPAARDGARRGALRLRGQRRVQPAEPGRRRGGLGRGRRAIVGARARGRPPRHRHARHRVRLPVRGRGRPRPRARRSPRGSSTPAPDEIVFADTVGVGVPRQVRATRRSGRRGSACPSACTCTTRATPASPTRWRRSRRARRCSTPRSAGSAAARSRRARRATSAPRTSSTSSTARASRPASTSTR